MAKVLKLQDIEKAIVDYVSDERKTQAVLLDGEWGCGKTFFVKEYLMPTLEKLENTKILKISLYGISDIEMIQEMIYAQWLEAYVGKMTNKWGVIGSAVSKGISFLGKPALRIIENKLGTEDVAEKLAANVFDDSINQNTPNIIIFDDIERCRIDIIQLMGFLNNLSENNRFKLILVANEKEVNRIDNPIEEALKYLVVMNNKEDVELKNNDRTGLKEAAIRIFGEESLYERTREKLIGLTIPYSVSVSEAFEAIIDKYIRNKDLQVRVKANKDNIIKILDENSHRNLRSLISACIAIEDILISVDESKFSEKELLNEEINTIILYSVYSAIRKSVGKLFQWPSDTRYTCVNSSLMESDQTKIYGYAFVDEYWKTQCVDKNVIVKDLQDRINYRNEIEKSRQRSQEHSNLAMYKLSDWYLLKDEDVKNLIQQMRNELAEKKYQPYEFKQIICTLMEINNPNFGMNYNINIKNLKNVVYDSTVDAQFVGMESVEIESVKHNYIDWDEEDITEFVQLMVSYFDNTEFTLTSEMIRILAEDKQYAYKYRMLTMPLLKMIENHNQSIASKDDNGISISDIPWDDSLKAVVKKKNEEYMNQGKFLSLFNCGKLKEHISSATSGEIHSFCEAVRSVYSFSNLSDVYILDLETVNDIITFIDQNDGKLINSEKSRTKEIALRRLTTDLKKYRKALGYVEKVI